MLSRYDTTQQARVDCEFARKYDTAQTAFIDCEFVRAYDETLIAWVDKLKKYFELSVTDNFYDITGNIVFCAGGTYACEVTPTSDDIMITATLEDDFINPVIACMYTFGHSDYCPNIASDFLSHACVDWIVKGYLNGVETKSAVIAYGSNYAYEKIFDEPKTLTLEGTFDKLEFVCKVGSYSNYANFNQANTSLENITIDGKSYTGKTVIRAE